MVGLPPGGGTGLGEAVQAGGTGWSEDLLDGMVAVEVADVVAGTGHLEGMDGGLRAEPGDEAAGGIDAATGLDADTDEAGIGAGVVVEGGYAPVALGLGGLLFHREDEVVVVHLGNTALAEALLGLLVVAHDAGGGFPAGVAHEVDQTERQQVVAGNDQEVVVELTLVDGKLDVAHRTETGLVGRGAVVEHGDGLRTLGGPLLEDGCKLMVGDDDVLVNELALVDIVDEPIEDGLPAYLQQGLGEVLGKGIEAGGIASREDEAFHILTPSALSQT